MIGGNFGVLIIIIYFLVLIKKICFVRCVAALLGFKISDPNELRF